jgi:hypothetical protein
MITLPMVQTYAKTASIVITARFSHIYKVNICFAGCAPTTFQ